MHYLYWRTGTCGRHYDARPGENGTGRPSAGRDDFTGADENGRAQAILRPYLAASLFSRHGRLCGFPYNRLPRDDALGGKGWAGRGGRIKAGALG